MIAFVASYWATCSILIHRSFHSNGWDLGLINQVIWNTAHGRPFQYSFRTISFSGDHWEPFLYTLVPLKWLGAGPEALLIVQAVVLALAAVPLYLSVRHSADARAAWALAGAYMVGLGAARLVSFDFHLEAFVPLLAFTALWGLVTKRPLAFIAAGLLILTLKEDGALLTLALCWIAWIAFRERTPAAFLAGAAVVYGFVATYAIIPHYRGADLNPFAERYSYLGDSPLEALLGIVRHPDLVASQMARWDALEAVVLILVSAALLPLAVPRLLPPLAAVMLIPMLSKEANQDSLDLHYFLVPSTLALVLAAVAISTRLRPDGALMFAWRPVQRRFWAPAVFALPALLFVLASPLPPSFTTRWYRFDVDHHAAVARDFVRSIADDATVSAQSPFVPHLSERINIYQFPRVLDAEYVVVDERGETADQDLTAGYKSCLAALPRLGFDVVRQEDGVTLWRKLRPAEAVPEAPEECSGQHPD